MPKTPNFAKLKTRPKVEQRLFRNDAIEKVIVDVSARIKDPEVKRMFVQCLPNTLDTTVHYREDRSGKPDTFVATGDIPAMWLRDSTNQVWPYLKFLREDEKLKKNDLLPGLPLRFARGFPLGHEDSEQP